MAGYIISIDMGGTKILAALLNEQTEIVKRLKIESTVGAPHEYYIEQIYSIIKNLINESEVPISEVKYAVLGIPGSVNPEKGKVGMAPNLGIKKFFIKEPLEKLLPFPIYIENDVNLAAIGIQYHENFENAVNILVVYIGTGIGASLILDKKLYRGSNFTAGEVGHMSVDKHGPLCVCGRNGCFEALASRTAIVKGILADIKIGEPSILTKVLAEKHKIKSGDLSFALKNEDPLTIKHILAACKVIASVLVDCTNLLNLDLIVLGGGVIEAMAKYMLPKIKAEFKQEVLKDSARHLKIKATKLGDDAALYGGFYYGRTL